MRTILSLHANLVVPKKTTHGLVLISLANPFPSFYSARAGRERGSGISSCNVSFPKILGELYFCVLLMDKYGFVGAEIKLSQFLPNAWEKLVY